VEGRVRCEWGDRWDATGWRTPSIEMVDRETSPLAWRSSMQAGVAIPAIALNSVPVQADADHPRRLLNQRGAGR
jgi:hypothetical protein